MASTLSNLYVEKASSEHPLALWMLNEQVDYVSQITEDERRFELFAKWDIVNAEAESRSSSELNAPFLDSATSVIEGFLPPTETMDIVLTSKFLLSSDLATEYANFNVGFYLFLETALANTISIGYKYTDIATSETVEVLSTKNLTSRYRDNWVFVSNTFDLPPNSSIAENIKIVIKVNVSGGGTTGAYDFLINGLSVGQWSEEFNKTSYGVTPNPIPTDIALPSELKSLPAFPYGASGQNAYYLSQDFRLFAKNFGVPIVFGSSNVTKISENVYDNVNYPSLIFPGYGFLNKRGRYNDYTIEMWIRVNATSSGTKKIFGPIASTDGLYVDESFLTLKVGNGIASHFVGDWFRPMLVHIRIVRGSAFLILNGEEVASIDINQETLELPDEFDNINRSQDWLGFYAYQDVTPIEIDTFSIYSYSMPTAIAKRRWVWGQAVTAPEQTNSSLNSITAFNDYAFANYAANYNYPDFANWKQAYFSNVNAESKVLSLPDYALPDFRLGSKTVTELFDDIKLIDSEESDQDDILNRKYITLYPNEDWNSESDHIYFENFGILNEPVQTVYGVFKTDGTETNKTLIKITNKINNNNIKVFINNSTVTYQTNIDGVAYVITTRTINSNEKFSVGLDISKLLQSQDSAINRFFTDQSSLDMYVAGDGVSKFKGQIYKIGFDAAYNSRRTSWMYDDDGIILPHVKYTITDVASKGRLFGGEPASVRITEIDRLNGNIPTSISYRVVGGLKPVAGEVSDAETVPKDSLYVAVRTAAASASYSEDGINWLSTSLPGGQKSYKSVAYGNDKFVIISDSSAAHSEDGINWLSTTLPAGGQWTSLIYGDGKFVIFGSETGGAYSTDGITWTEFNAYAFSPGPALLAYGSEKFVAIFDSTLKGLYSANGISWTEFNLPSISSWRAITYGNDKFVATSNGLTAAYSEDGISWTGFNMPSSGDWNSLTYGDGKFVALKSNSSNAAYSTDGINWTTSTLPSSAAWTTITYGNGKFIALSTTTSTFPLRRAAYSENGISWTAFDMPNGQWSFVTHGTPTEAFVSFGTTATVAEVTQIGETQAWDAELKNLDATEVAKLRVEDTITATVGTDGKLTFTTSENHNYLIGDSISTVNILSSPTSQFNLSEQEVVSLTEDTFTINSSTTATYTSGGIVTDTANILHNHTANYTLTAIDKYDLLFPDIAVAGYWEDYMPLSYFGKSITDFDLEKNYELDIIQYNQDFPQPPKSEGSLELSTWTYAELRAEYSVPIVLTYEDLNNEFYTGWQDYFEMSQNSVRTNFYDTTSSTLRSYISFQPILDGANRSLADFSSFAKPLTSGIIDPAASSLDWEQTAFETTSGTVIYPPVRTFSTNNRIDFEKYAIVYHLDFRSSGIFHNPIRFKELQLASQVLERTDFTSVGSRFGIPVYYYSKRGIYFDLKGKNPISTYKKSTPYLYLDRNSGWKLQGDFDSTVDRGIAIPVNLSKAGNEDEPFEVSSVQMWVRFADRDFPLDPVMIFSIDHNDGTYDFFIKADASEQRGYVFAVDRETQEVIDGIGYYLNGQSVDAPFLVRDEWAVLGLEFERLLDFTSRTGLINLNGPLTYNNVSYNLATNIEKNETLEARIWSDMVEVGTWEDLQTELDVIDGSTPPFKWQQVKVISENLEFTVDPKAIYEKYTGSNRIVVDDNSSGILIDPDRIRIYKDVTWSENLKVPV